MIQKVEPFKNIFFAESTDLDNYDQIQHNYVNNWA